MSQSSSQTVIKKNGSLLPFDRKKFFLRVKKTLPTQVEEERKLAMTNRLVDIVLRSVTWPVHTRDLEERLCTAAAQLTVEDPYYMEIAQVVELNSIYSSTEPKFSDAMVKAQHILSGSFLDLVLRNRQVLDDMIRHNRDCLLSFLALRTLKRTYFLRDRRRYYERPQHVWLRVALQVHGDDIDSVRTTYTFISQIRFMPASPILFNSGTRLPQLSSCYLLSTGDRVEDIFDVMSSAANISQGGGGIGLGLQDLPSQGEGARGESNAGLVPILKMLDATADVIAKGSVTRPSAINVYIEPWHADVLSFVRMKRNSGVEEAHTDRLFYTLWMNDIFMTRVDTDKEWTLFDPADVPTLSETYGLDFDEEYEKFEMAGMGKATIQARELWKEILVSQIETGGPSIMFKDSINSKSNQKHLGSITQSNLCTEIVQYCSRDEPAVCNLASVALPMFVTDDGAFDFDSLETVVRQMVLFLNCVIHTSVPPLDAALESMYRHRSIGIGVQGLADTFATMGIPYDSDRAYQLNLEIAQTIYYSSVDESCNLINRFGTYSSFKDSPTASGWLQCHLWQTTELTDRYDWARLSEKVTRGMANSLLVAYMPTAGTSQITGCTECFEPYADIIYTRKLLAGDFTVIPAALVDRLRALGLWEEDLINAILASDGSIQHLKAIPKDIREIFKTVWDIDPEVIVKMAAARAPFICQSQSMSLYFESPTLTDVSRALFLAWKSGLKTGLYYLRTKPAAKPQPISLPVEYWGAFRDNSEPDLPSCTSCSA
ncbi:hypothetical protein NMY22_g8398 [Coprinellus aureogranulatus]|nr:hypothetical protein NMY22_g8398 [Coprinellus aureogranulatus]